MPVFADYDTMVREAAIRNLSLSALAKRATVHRSSIDRIRRGLPIEPGTLHKIAKALDSVPIQTTAATLLPAINMKATGERGMPPVAREARNAPADSE
jgi:transcriptional regulator with XRE-family HTH domain